MVGEEGAEVGPGIPPTLEYTNSYIYCTCRRRKYQVATQRQGMGDETLSTYVQVRTL
jgi:hypothetical protein